MLDFATTDFDKAHTRSKFIYDKDAKPKHIYRHDLTKFELREIKEQNSTVIICELKIQDIDKENIDIQFQFAQYFLVDTKLYFLIATQRTDGLESFLYFFDPLSWQSTLRRVEFTVKLKGKLTNIFVSDKLKNGKDGEYHILTIGTLDSALYVTRFIMRDMFLDSSESEKREGEDKEKKVEPNPFSCTLLRTDARSAITQGVIVLNNQSKTPADIYLVCGGSNGALDFFLLQGEADISAKPKLQFQRHDLIKLPSKLPIISLQCLQNSNDKQILLAVGQQLLKVSRISRLLEPSMTILKINVKNLLCKDKASMKFPCGTQIMPLQEDRLWSCFTDVESICVTRNEFDIDTFKFGEKHNIFMDLPSIKQTAIQQVFMDEESCWMLSDDQLSLSAVISKKGHKRKLST